MFYILLSILISDQNVANIRYIWHCVQQNQTKQNFAHTITYTISIPIDIIELINVSNLQFLFRSPHAQTEVPYLLEIRYVTIQSVLSPLIIDAGAGLHHVKLLNTIKVSFFYIFLIAVGPGFVCSYNDIEFPCVYYPSQDEIYAWTFHFFLYSYQNFYWLALSIATRERGKCVTAL